MKKFTFALIAILCITLVAEARPFRRLAGGCSGGSCQPAMPTQEPPQVHLTPYVLPYQTPIHPMQLGATAACEPTTQPIQVQSGCANGQCGVQPQSLFGRVTLRSVRR